MTIEERWSTGSSGSGVLAMSADNPSIICTLGTSSTFVIRPAPVYVATLHTDGPHRSTRRITFQ